MLTHLYIKNYALITELDMDFYSALSCLTGETGAGKSIILGALGLLMGNRADSRSITEGEQKCVIEAEFIGSDEVERLCRQNDLDYSGTIVLRRELLPTKSRAFANDTPVSLPLMRELADCLIDIHSQHQNLLLKDDAFQLSVVDVVADNAFQRKDYAEALTQYQHTERELRRLQELARRSREDADYVAFQYKQLDEARLVAGEWEQLDREQQLLSHTEEVKQALTTATALLEDAPSGVVQNLKETLAALRRISDYLPTEDNLTDRLDSAYIELRDIADEVRTIAERTDFDPQRLQQVEERLDLLNSLMQKHHLQTVDELITLRDNLQEQLQRNENYDTEIAALQKLSEEQLHILQQSALALRRSRQQVTQTIADRLMSSLNRLGMPNAHIEVSLTERKDYSASGADNVQFLFSANRNQSLRQVQEVASGGEIARIMLSIKALMAEGQGLPTLIFDEIDTGVSGEVASNIGQMMQQMAQHRQILTITHLPQIAAKAEHHYKVYKQDTEQRTETHIRLLGQEERVSEIATLLSGSEITSAAISNAKELLCYH